jgi:hypothetical protein
MLKKLKEQEESSKEDILGLRIEQTDYEFEAV